MNKEDIADMLGTNAAAETLKYLPWTHDFPEKFDREGFAEDMRCAIYEVIADHLGADEPSEDLRYY